MEPKPASSANTGGPATHASGADGLASLRQARVLHRQGQLAQADSLYQQVLLAQPGNFEALHGAGVIACQQKNLERAVELLDKAIGIDPSHALASFNRGIALEGLGRHGAALQDYDRAIALKPRHAAVHYNRGNVLRSLGRLEEAVQSYARATAIQPDHAQSQLNAGMTLRSLKRYQAAVDCFDRVIAAHPGHAPAHYNRGNALMDLQRHQAALESYGQALALEPGYAQAWLNRGNALRELEQFEQAVESFDRAIASRADYGQAHFNRGNALRELGRHEESLESFRQAVALMPQDAEAHWNLGLCCLRLGMFEPGWDQYEWRWRRVENRAHARSFAQPRWTGSGPPPGKTILLYAEQGLGDSLQFCRYASLLADQGARVVLEVQAALLPLLAGLPGVAQLVAKGAVLPDFDLHCPLLSLPQAFKTRLDTIPWAGPYLKSDPGRLAAWRARLGASARPRIGLVWSGNAAHANDSQRSIALAELIGALPPGFQYLSLQKELREADRQTLLAHPEIRHFGEDLHDFADTAALCELVDLVIGVDTSVIHLAGAMGRPVWVLLQRVPDWRWMLDTVRSPWYPSARLYRQPGRGDWSGLLRAVSQDLRQTFDAMPGSTVSAPMDIHVISLARTPQRLQSFVQRNGTLPCQQFEAVDGSRYTAESFAATGDCDGTVNYTQGAMGCALSHLALWRRSVETHRPLTVCEDDAIFHREFQPRSQAIIDGLGADWDLVLWGWNFDSVLLCDLIPGLSACDVRFSQKSMRQNAASYVKAPLAARAHRLYKAFGIPCYSISPGGAARLLEHCVPIRKMDVHFPGLNRTLPNNGIDIMMNKLYPACQAYVCFPPLVLTDNDHAISTVQIARA